MSRTNRVSVGRYDFPLCFPSEEILNFQFRILTFPSVYYAISQSNYMQSSCFQKIWSYFVFRLWNDGLGARLAWLSRYVSSDSADFNYSHFRIDQLLFGVDYRTEIRLIWRIGGIWLKWCWERSELVWVGMVFPLRFPSEEILKFHFRILTFPSVYYAIRQSNYMQSSCFQEIWSYLVFRLWIDVSEVRLAWLQRYVWVIQFHSIIHIVEMIRYYLASTTVLKYDCCEELEAFGWNDVENEAN